MKKFLALLLAVLMIFACTACGKKAENNDADNAVTEVYDPTRVYDIPESVTSVECDNPINFINITVGDYETNETKYISAVLSEISTCDIDYSGDERKVGKFDASLFGNITNEFAASGLAELNGQSVYEEGTAYATVYVTYADGTFVTADYTGTIPQEFTDGFKKMDSFFLVLANSLPKYVPQPSVMGEVNEEILAEMMGVLNKTGIETLDTFTISDILMDEFFAVTAGLTNAEGVNSAAICAPMMMTTPYSLVVVSCTDADAAAAVHADFAANVDWQKWVCVAPTNALIADKGNMVLCLMASDELYTKTADAVHAAGWTNLQELDNPNM